MDAFSVVGNPGISRVDAAEKATGRAAYTADMVLPRMLVGRVLRSPYHHAAILNVDAARARNLRGVKAVITGAEAPRIKIGRNKRDEEVLAVQKVRFMGDHVAAVAAVDEDTAEEALRLIKVEYAPLPAVFDPVEAMQPGAPRVHDTDTNLGHHFAYTRGDPDQGFAEANLVFEETFHTPRQHVAAMEPHCVLASFETSAKGRIWTGMKDIFAVRRYVSEYLEIPESDIRVFQAEVGGCFGGKSTATRGAFCCIAALLSRTTGQPVKMINSRQEELAAGRHRFPAMVKMKLGVKADGTVTAKDTTVITNSGAYLGLGVPIFSTTARRHESLYRFTNLRTEAFLVYTNTAPGSPFRGFGSPQGHFALESMMDIAAQKLGLDPIEMRLKNATRTGDVTAHGWEIQSCGLSECIRNAKEETDWEKRRSNRPSGVGLGIGCMIHISGRRFDNEFFGSRAMVKIEKDGRVRIFSGEGELGQGSHTVFAIIAAEELGIPLGLVAVAQPDTDVSPLAHGLFSDRGTILGGNAVRLAARDAKRQLLHMAAEMMEANADDLTIRDGRIFVQGSPDRSVSVPEVAGYALSKRNAEPVILGKASYDPPNTAPDPVTLYGNISTSYTFAAHVVEAHVDHETGQVRVARIHAAHDLGKTINPTAAAGQVEGATIQGLGYTLLEELFQEEGIPNGNFLDYRVPTSLDVPMTDTVMIETDDPFGPFGAKGVGEPALVATAPAVANAVCDAVGVRITELPITPEKVLRGLQGDGDR